MTPQSINLPGNKDRLVALTPRQRMPTSISVVVPCYNEQEVLAHLKERLLAVLAKVAVPFEVILVDDGSSDNTWPIMQQFASEGKNFKVVRLSRNHGHQLALTCGLDQACGEVLLIIDADLQDPPELLEQMLAKWSEGYDVIYGKRQQRHGESLSKRVIAYCFYRIFRKITGFELPSDTGDFRLMDRRAVTALQTLKERHRFIRGMVSWIGFAQTPIFYNRPARVAGVTKYPIKKSALLALDAIVSFSYAPLRLASYLGVFLSMLSFLYIFVIIGLKIAGINFPGYTSIMASMLLLGGVQLVVLGLIGEYIGRIFEQGQRRPLYLIDSIQGEPLRPKV